MTKTISVYNNEFNARWILDTVETYSSVSAEEVIAGNNHHITLSSSDNLGATMIKRLIDTVKRDWKENDYMIS